MSDLEIRVESAIGGHATAWDALVDSMALPSPFLRSWWIDATVGAEPCIVTVHRDDVLVGGLALERRPLAGIDWLSFAGGGALGRDHLDLVAAPDGQSAVADALRAWFARTGSRLITLAGAAEHASVAAALPGRVRSSVVAGAPWTSLPATFESYLAARPSVLRNTIRKVGRRLERAGVRYEVAPPWRVDGALEDLARFHRQSFGYRSALLARFDAFARAVRAGSRCSEVRFHELRVGDTTIATEVWFEVAGVGSCYQSGRDDDEQWSGSGTVLKARAIEEMVGRGISQIDLLRADEPYKRAWTSDTRVLLGLDAATGVRGRAMRVVLPASRWSYASARRALRPVRRFARALRGRR